MWIGCRDDRPTALNWILMPSFLRAAAAAAASLCVALLGYSSPSEAQQAPVAGLATAMLASVSTPLITVQPAMLDLATPVFAPPSARPDEDAPSAATLAALVAERETSDTAGDDHECLADAVYFESRGEPLEGQLGVAQVILNRAASGRFAGTACGVIRQRSQFSFVHGGVVPDARRDSAEWRTAVAVAAVARDKLWKPVARDAMYFGCGASGKTRVAALGHHVFYR